MIYFVGGPPRCGKTTIAQRLAHSLHIPWVSADTLESVTQRYIPKSMHDIKFPKNALKNKNKNHDEMYSKYTTKQITNAYIKQTKATHKAIDGMVDHALSEEYDYVMEGHHVHPHVVKGIEDKYGPKNFRKAFLTRYDIDKIIKGCKLHGQNNKEWFIHNTKNQEILPRIAAMINNYSNYFEEEAKKHGYKVFNMDCNFLKNIPLVTKYLRG